MEIDNSSEEIMENTIVFSSEEEMFEESNNFGLNLEAVDLAEQSGLSYEDAVKFIEENKIAEKRAEKSVKDKVGKTIYTLNSENWGLLSQLEPNI